MCVLLFLAIIDGVTTERKRIFRMPQPEKMPINQQLRNERLQRHWSQQELADQLGTTVISIKRWERNITTPSPYFRLKLTPLFGKSAEELGLLKEEGLLPQTQKPDAETPATTLEDPNLLRILFYLQKRMCTYPRSLLNKQVRHLSRHHYVSRTRHE